MSGNGEKRPVSAGTKVMLVMLILVIAGSALVLGRLSSGASVDLNKLNRNLLDLGRAVKDDAGDAAVKAPETQNAVYPGKDGKREGADDDAIRKAEMSETAGAAGTSSGGTVARGLLPAGPRLRPGVRPAGQRLREFPPAGRRPWRGFPTAGPWLRPGLPRAKLRPRPGRRTARGKGRARGRFSRRRNPRTSPRARNPGATC